MCLLFISGTAPALGAANCKPQRIDTKVEIQSIVDGDTVRLKDGRLLRFIGINTPEIDHKGRQSEAYAEAAREQLRELVKDQPTIGLQYGAESTDTHGRALAHVFTGDGRNIQAELLEQGLAAWIVVPPNLQLLECYREAEAAARASRRGLWQDPLYQPSPVSQLPGDSRGFRFVRGTVTRVGHSKKSLWLNMGKSFALRIQKTDLVHFTDYDPASLEGRTVIARGWVYPYKQQIQMRVRHPAALEIIDN